MVVVLWRPSSRQLMMMAKPSKAALILNTIVANDNVYNYFNLSTSLSEWLQYLVRETSRQGDVQGVSIQRGKNTTTIQNKTFTTGVMTRAEARPAVRFRVALAGREHVVALWPSRALAGSAPVVERRRRDVRRASFRRPPLDQCHYEGRVLGRRHSRAALSSCADGLFGYVFTGDDHFFVEPADGQTPDEDGRHVHVAYRGCAFNPGFDIDVPSRRRRRATTNPPSGDCSMDGDWRMAWQQRFRDDVAHHRQLARGATSESPSDRIRWIEVALVCDKSFVEYHVGKDTDTYLLTLFNVAANIWHDESIGRPIHLVLVRIMYLDNEDEEKELNITSDAENSLKSFNKWAQRVNPSEDHPNHHDVAVLLTKHNLCKARNDTPQRCSAVGVAMTAQGCNPAKSGCIAEDAGLLTGTTIAHLIGHLMGCAHDSVAPGDSGCDSKLPDGSPVVMAPPSGHVTTWSKCSRTMLEQFMTRGLGYCLTDEPRATPYEKKLYDMLPGSMYDADYQCSDMLETAAAEKCPIWEEKSCEELWCLVAGTSCVSLRGRAAADGTPCGAGKWCYAAECVERGRRPHAVDGGWSAWSDWTECSRSCGGGAQTQARACDNPKPSRGGFYCQGAHKQYRVCNMRPCDPKRPSYRNVQCSAYDARVFEGVRYKWKEFAAAEKPPCELVCLGNDEVFSTLAKCAQDGTPCRKGTRDMCVDCECMPVDCEWVIGGKSIEDPCGICNGNGVHCREVNEFYNESQKTIGIQHLTTIPEGSYKVTIEEMEPSTNDVAIGSPDMSKWYLNGKNTTDEIGETKFGSVIGMFTTPDKDREMIVIRGPTMEELGVFYSFTGLSPLNPGVTVKYNFRTNETRTLQYVWDFVVWSSCPVVCGGGTQISNPDCVEKTAGKVNDELCDPFSKPMPKSRKCNPQACKIKWHTGAWSNCSGCLYRTGVQIRKVWCMEDNPNPNEDPIHIENKKCLGVKPLNFRLCTRRTPCTQGLFRESSHGRKVYSPEKKGTENWLTKSSTIVGGTKSTNKPKKNTKTVTSTQRRDNNKSVNNLTSLPKKTSTSKLQEHSDTLHFSTEGKLLQQSDKPTAAVFENKEAFKVNRNKETPPFVKRDENGQSLIKSVKGPSYNGASGVTAKPPGAPVVKEMKMQFSTPTYNSSNVVADSFPDELLTLREAPLLPSSLKKSLSDEAQQEMGGGGDFRAQLDTSKMKEYRGQQAGKRWLELQKALQNSNNGTVQV